MSQQTAKFPLNSNNEFLLISLVFLVVFVLHIASGNYTRSLQIQPDELLYYDIAKNIFNGHGLSYFLGDYCNFKKIAYSLIISPAFAIEDGILRMQFINALNCIIILSSIIPGWLIFKNLTITRTNRILATVLLICTPELLASATVMSEVLYWPIFLSWVYVWLINEKRQSYKLSLLLGLLTFIGYWTKELFLVLPLAQIITTFLWIAVNSIRTRQFSLSSLFNHRICLIILELAFFWALTFVVEISFFTATTSNYGGVKSTAAALTDVLTDLTQLKFFSYGVLYYFIGILLSVWLLPVIVPLVTLDRLPEQTKRLFLWSVLFCIITTVVVGIMITAQEDIGDITPRLHLRYFGPCLPLFYAVFLSCTDWMPFDKKTRILVEISSILALGLAVTIFAGITIYSPIDQFSLLWFKLLDLAFGSAVSSSQISFTAPATIASKVLLAGLVLGCMLRSRQSGRHCRRIFLLIVLGFCSINTIFGILILHQFSHRDLSEIQNIEQINNYLSSHMPKDGTLAYVTRNADIQTFNNAVTYITGSYRMVVLNDKTVTQANRPGVLLKDKFQDPILKRTYNDISSAEYILVDRGTNLKWLRFAHATPIAEVSNNQFTLMRNTNPEDLALTANSNVFFGGKHIYASFAKEAQPGAFVYVDSGIGRAVTNFVWTFSRDVSFVIPVTGFTGTMSIELKVAKTHDGMQRYSVLSNNVLITEGSIEKPGTIAFNLQATQPFTRFTLHLPDAKKLLKSSQSSEDMFLGIAIESLSIRAETPANGVQ